jgi:hypothetical protein
MPRQTTQQPPYDGWEYDPQTRGWFDGSFFSLQQAKSFDPNARLTGTGRTWISRRQYDQEFGWLDIGHGWKTRNFRSLSSMSRYIENMPQNQRIIVRAYGEASTTSPKLENEPDLQYRTVMNQRFVHSYHESSVKTLYMSNVHNYVLTAKFPVQP